MPVNFEDEHRLLRESTRRFVEREILPDVDAWEEAGSFPRDLYRKAGAAGLLRLGFPEEDGGTGPDPLMLVVFTEEMMRCTSAGVVAGLGSLGIGLPPVVTWGSPELKARIVPPVLAGDKIMALAITEPGGGSDVANLHTRAERTEQGFRVTGQKTFITSGCRADYYTVAVRTGGEGYAGISLLLMEASMPGFHRSQPLKKMGWWASDTAELSFDHVLVPFENLIGPENAGFYAIMSNFQMERLSLAVMANSTAQMALETCLAYVKEREAFGRSLNKFQVMRHKLVEMATQVEVSRQYTYHVAELMKQGQAVVREVSMAKNFSTRVSDQVTHEAVQIFAGAGYMRGTLVERLYRDNRILSIGGGTYEIMNEVIAKQMNL